MTSWTLWMYINTPQSHYSPVRKVQIRYLIDKLILTHGCKLLLQFPDIRILVWSIDYGCWFEYYVCYCYHTVGDACWRFLRKGATSLGRMAKISLIPSDDLLLGAYYWRKQHRHIVSIGPLSITIEKFWWVDFIVGHLPSRSSSYHVTSLIFHYTSDNMYYIALLKKCKHEMHKINSLSWKIERGCALLEQVFTTPTKI